MKRITEIIIPREEKKLTISEIILKTLSSNSMTSFQLAEKMGRLEDSHIRSTLSNMVKTGQIKQTKCPKCEIGNLYEVGK